MNVERCTKGTMMKQYDTHAHAGWEIIAINTGKLDMVIEGHLHKIGSTGVVVLPPNTKHSGSSDVEFCDVYVEAKKLDFHGIEIVQDPDHNILTLMNLLNKVLLEKEKNYKNIADSLLEAICQYIKKLVDVESKYDFVTQLKNMIFEEFSDPEFSIRKEIEKIGFQQDYMRRCFKDETGKTPLEYLTYLRINLAKSLLVQSPFSGIEDVSRKCGFKDSFYFSSCFRKHTGYSPSGYRKHYREN